MQPSAGIPPGAIARAANVPPMEGRQLISSGTPWELVVGYSRAVRVDSRVVVAGTAAQWPDGTVDPDPAVQAREAICEHDRAAR